MRIRNIMDDDWDSVMTLETEAYPAALAEDRAALCSKQRISPSTCFVLDDGQIAGYVLALPYPRFRYPALAQVERITHRSRNLHLHDLVVGARFRGRGLARQLLGTLVATARAENYEWISLIAVAGSGPFWRGQGFCPWSEVDVPRDYGADAVYMSRAV